MDVGRIVSVAIQYLSSYVRQYYCSVKAINHAYKLFYSILCEKSEKGILSQNITV